MLFLSRVLDGKRELRGGRAEREEHRREMREVGRGKALTRGRLITMRKGTTP
jgi:hypothetical protein